ncbi:MAG: preprotein translocase subunit SecE [Methylococcaceae bacterium]
MTAQAETSVSITDVLKIFTSVVLVVGGIVSFYFFSELQLIYRVLGIVLLVIVALGLLLTTQGGGRVWSFMVESRQEVRKVVWPSRQETVQTTMMVFAMVFLVGLLLWLLDMFLFWAIRFLTGQGG